MKTLKRALMAVELLSQDVDQQTCLERGRQIRTLSLLGARLALVGRARQPQAKPHQPPLKTKLPPLPAAIKALINKHVTERLSALRNVVTIPRAA